MADDIESGNKDAKTDTLNAAETQSRLLHEAKDRGSKSGGSGMFEYKLGSDKSQISNFPSENKLMAMLGGQEQTEIISESSAPSPDKDRSPVREFEDLASEMKKIFPKLDLDNNGYVNQAELDKAMLDPNFKGREAQAIYAMRQFKDAMQNSSNDEWGPENDGITKDDLKVYQDTIPGKSDLSTAVSESFIALHNGTNTLFSDRMSNPLDSINPSAVFLGKIDDCGFMSDLASMSATDKGKQQIKDMLQDNGINQNGVHTYTVTFPGQKNNPITVVEPTDAQKIEYAKPTMFGIWPSILEKAYAQYKAGQDNNKMPVQEVLKNGSKTLEDMQLLSGKTAKHLSLESANKELVEKTILESLRDGNPISVSRSVYSTKFDSSDWHKYAVTGYDPEKQEVVLKNTEGRHPSFAGPNTGGPDGIFRLPLGARDRERVKGFLPSVNFMNLDALNYVE